MRNRFWEISGEIIEFFEKASVGTCFLLSIIVYKACSGLGDSSDASTDLTDVIIQI